MITLDGSTLEGGGQLVRVALSLSAIHRIPIRVSKVRANRAPKSTKRGAPTGGGLKESHLAALNWLAQTCGAKTKGDEVGSEEFVFRTTCEKGQLPGPAKSSIVLKKPGSVWLVLQAVLPFIIFTLDVPSLELTLKGGTNVPKSMSGEYVQQVLAPTLRRIGVPQIDVDVVKRGWAGNAGEIGEVKVTITTATERPFSLPPFKIADSGAVQKIAVTVVAHGETMRSLLKAELTTGIRAEFGANIAVEVVVDEESGSDSRLYVLLVAHTKNGWRLGRDALYSRKIQNEKEARAVVEKASASVVKQLADEISKGGCVDEYLQDQLVIWQALASGDSFVDGGGDGAAESDGSLHTKTVRWVCQEMLADEISFEAGGGCLLRAKAEDGAGQVNEIDTISSALEAVVVKDGG